MSNPITKKPASWPVVEIFGPTIQGEGVDQGVVSHFVRFGGCDYRCTWCDTPHAVLPAEVKANARKMTALQIVEELDAIETHQGNAPWIILTGGNPALLDLTELIEKLHDMEWLVAVETQGSRWRDWMWNLDRVCVSPKPPSAFAGLKPMPTPDQRNEQLHHFLEKGLQARAERSHEWLFVKVVVFNDEDLNYAELLRHQLSDALLYISTGNDAGRTVGQPERTDDRTLDAVRRDLLDKTLWLTQEVFKRPALCASNVIVQSQQHVLLWGNELGR